ncbi:hypothetical protein PC112_g17654 [Phytophthora cactorum]|nr:hypothetical protein PC112_g17654 [Phytophthora cactorum]
MGKNRFVVNPFGHLALSELNKSKLKEFAYNFFDQSVLKYEAFIGDGGPKVDPKEWKLIKTKDDTRVYLERDPPIRTSISGSVSDHPGLLMTGITWGTVEDSRPHPSIVQALTPSQLAKTTSKETNIACSRCV